MVKPSACIVIPVYKLFERLKATEQTSWQQCLRVLGSYKLYLVHPPQLELGGYRQALAAANIAHDTVAFAAPFFADVMGYNRLVLSRSFYQPFAVYEYMLLYQLDAFVFEDQLPTWCAKGYSYVGAPWFKGFVPAEAAAELWQVGNGGFSLRRIPDALRVLNSWTILRPWTAIYKEHFTQHQTSNWKAWLRLGKRLALANNTYWRFNDYSRYVAERQEDYFWGVECARKFAWYKVPTPQEALAFSFEVHPHKMYELNGHRLPMGCHAWDKYNPAFWQEIIGVV